MLAQRGAHLGQLGEGVLGGGAELVALAPRRRDELAQLGLLTLGGGARLVGRGRRRAQRLDRVDQLVVPARHLGLRLADLVVALGEVVLGAQDVRAALVELLLRALDVLVAGGELGLRALDVLVALGELGAEVLLGGDDGLDLAGAGDQLLLRGGDLLLAAAQLGGERLDGVGVAGPGGALVERRELGGERLLRAQDLGLLGAQLLDVLGWSAGPLLLQRGDLLTLGGQLGLERVDARAGVLGVALEVGQAAALVAGEALGLVTLDGDLGELLAQRVGLALDVLDPLQRGLQLGAGGLCLALAVALDALERLGELVAGGLDGLLVLGADLLELGDQVGLLVLGVAAAELLELEDARLERAAGAVGAAAGLGERLLGAALGLGDGVGHAALDRLGGAGAVGLRALQALGELGTGGLGGLQGGGAGGVLVEARALEALHAREQLEVLGVVAAGLDLADGALEVGAQARGLALGGVGAAAARLGVAARLLHLRGQGGGHALEVVDALQRGEQARDDRGGVVEVADRAALDAGIRVGDGLLDLGVGLGAGGLARGELLLDPRGRLGRAEDDERAGRAPALPGLDLVLERLAQRAHDDGVLLAHAQQHQVERAARSRGPPGTARSRSPRRA